MKKLLLDAYCEAKTLPKVLWVIAIIVPCGLTTAVIYIAGKTAYHNFKKKEDKHD